LSERFSDLSERFADVSEQFIDVSERSVDLSERIVGRSERFIDASERSVDVSERFVGMSERFIDVSERSVHVSKLLKVENANAGREETPSPQVFSSRPAPHPPLPSPKASGPMSRAPLRNIGCALAFLPCRFLDQPRRFADDETVSSLRIAVVVLGIWAVVVLGIWAAVILALPWWLTRDKPARFDLSDSSVILSYGGWLSLYRADPLVHGGYREIAVVHWWHLMALCFTPSIVLLVVHLKRRQRDTSKVVTS
jgi:hypothetical protein